MEPYIAQISAFGFNFAPRNWATCDGQLLPIAQNQALFSLIGTTFGGNGQTTFALPDLRGRSIRHFGQGPGLPGVQWGERSGAESVALSVGNLPNHTHNVSVGVNTAPGNSSVPTNQLLSNCPATYNDNFTTPPVALGGVTEATVGQGIPFSIRNPYLTVNICIALFGIFPSRN